MEKDMIQIKTLNKIDFPNATKILITAFRNDPMIVHIFPRQKAEHRLTFFFEFLLAKSRLLHERLYGLYINGDLACVACMEEPAANKPAMLEILKIGYHVLLLMLGIPFHSFIFINKYMKFTSSARPKNRHHYLVFIGLHPSYHGKGLGKLMLDHLHTLVKGEPASQGIGLDTENPKNVALYEHFGYEVLETQVIESVTIYSMFKSTSI